MPDGVPRVLAATGVALMPEGRGVFPSLTVAEIWSLGLGSAGIAAGERSARVDWVLSVLPPVKDFYTKRAGLLSGGQQHLMAPIRALQRERGMSILLVEQNVREALKVSDRVVVMKAGRMVREALPAELADNAALMELY